MEEGGFVERRSLRDRRGVRARPTGRWSWRRVLGTGIVLFLVAAVALLATGNPNLYPTVSFVGSFLVPIVFVAFLYDHQHWTTLSFESLVRAFVLGGVLGVLGASILEPLLLPRFLGAGGGMGFGAGVVVGLIEEGCKLVAVVLVARGMRHTGALDGLLVGASVGMGFAALESSGYAFTVLLATRGDVQASLVETVLRGFLSPFGHGVWTAIAGCVLFRASAPDRFRWSAPVWLAFGFVVLLHAAWDGLTINPFLLPFGVPVSGSMVAVAAIGIVALAVLFRSASAWQWALERKGELPMPSGDDAPTEA